MDLGASDRKSQRTGTVGLDGVGTVIKAQGIKDGENAALRAHRVAVVGSNMSL